MGKYTQDNRLIRVHTPLGKDVLLLQSFSGQESISKLFQFDLRMHSEKRDIAFDDVVGKGVTVEITLNDGSSRHINGLISSFSQAGSSRKFAHYQATVVPWLWLLTRTSDCRIFQKKTAPDIIQQIFKEYGFADFKLRIHDTYEEREYCVQYRETDFNFVSRLMEEEGIFYFFEHEESKHTLVLADKPNEFKPCPKQPSARIGSAAGAEHWFEDFVTDWSIGQEIRPGKFTYSDFNFETPRLDLTASVDGKDKRKYEVYDWAGDYMKRGRGERLVGVRMEEEDTPRILASGSSTCRAFLPGYKFELEEHYRNDLNKGYVLTSISHSADQGDNYEGAAEAVTGDFHYTNYFQCIPHPTPFRPPRTTYAPVVQGSQTAIVVGPKGEEIYVDKYGRVKVQFHWDREGKYDENSSCFVRISRDWAGKRWGAMFTPRIGQEVIVDFLEGDADQPIITGSVYNGDMMPPYTLPDEKTKSTIKSNSSKGGGGFNEIRFEDLKDKEQIFIHGERNQDIRIKKDLMEWIGQDSHLIVKRDKLEKIEGDKHSIVTGDHNEKIDGTISRKAAMDIQEKAGMKYALDAGIEAHVKGGMNVVIEAGMSITLKAGGGFVVVGPAGVTISGTPVLINSGGAAGSGSGSSPQAPKPPTEADKAEPGERGEMPPPKVPERPPQYSPAAIVLQQAAVAGTPFCDI